METDDSSEEETHITSLSKNNLVDKNELNGQHPNIPKQKVSPSSPPTARLSSSCARHSRTSPLPHPLRLPYYTFLASGSKDLHRSEKIACRRADLWWRNGNRLTRAGWGKRPAW